jgi:tetratricopeptide (TPR) repeat protein
MKSRSRFIAIALLAMLTAASRPATAKSHAGQDTVGLMSTTELEKAADEARSQKNYDLAITYLRAAVREDRKNSVLYNKLGLAELKKEDYQSARADFEKAVKRNARFAEAVNNLGAAEYLKKNYSAAAKNFKKAVALEETRAVFHVNLGAAWFSQKKMEQAIAEYTRAVELDPAAFQTESKVGIAAKIASPEERAQYAYLLAKIYAKRGDVENCLQCLRKAKEDGYPHLAKVYQDEEFSRMRDNPRLQELVPPPIAK